MKGMYLYAVTAGEHILHLGPYGLPDGSTQVLPISAAGLTAIASPYEGPPSSELPREETFRRLVIHQRVIEQVSDEWTVLPVRFGTILASEDEVRGTLQRFLGPLSVALREVNGAVEVDLTVTWDMNAIFADIAQEPDVAALTGAIAGGNLNENLAERVRVGMLVQEAKERRREEYRRRIVGDLVSYTRDAGPTSSPLTDDVVVSLAVLVDRSAIPQFDAAVDRLGEELGSRLTFRYVGPLPPYSFATVDVVRPDTDTVEAARRALGLAQQVSRADLQHAYRRLAAKAHPDRHQGDRDAQERFALLASARDTIDDFISGQPTDERQPSFDHKHDLTPESVARSLLLRVSRSDARSNSLHQTSNEPQFSG